MRNDNFLNENPVETMVRESIPEQPGIGPGLSVSWKPQPIISGFRKTLIKIRMRTLILLIVLKNYRNPFLSVKTLRQLILLRRAISGGRGISKYSRVGGKYYCAPYTPGLGSKAFVKFIESEANRLVPFGYKTNRFTNVFVSVTKSCPLRCEHCFEWEALNRPDTLTKEAISAIVAKVQQMGTSQIQITGGEPLTKMDRVLEVLKLIGDDTETWVLTSGYNLTFENAQKLKSAGLTGVVISLDHFDPVMHNQFRGSSHSFDWVKGAVENAIANNLVTALSLCATNTFITESNLMQYAELAKNLGVSLIQVLEPRASGHYLGKDVELTKENERILEDFYAKLSYDNAYREYPIVFYHGQYNRRIGCMSSGERNLYIDTDGDLHACPFCRSKLGSFLSPDAVKVIEQYRAEGCHIYGRFEH